MTKLLVAFRNFVNVPTSENSIRLCGRLIKHVVNFLTPFQRQCAVKPSEMTDKLTPITKLGNFLTFC